MTLQERKDDLPGFMAALGNWIASQSPDPYVALAGITDTLIQILFFFAKDRGDLNRMAGTIIAHITDKVLELGEKRWGG
jgi:hypothetical protein